MSKTQVRAEPNQNWLTTTREFDAPRELVFKAYSDRELVSKWWGPKDYEIEVDKFEGEGGAWRIIHRNKDGEYAFHGVFHEIKASERIIWTFEYEGLPEPGHVLLETISFTDIGNGRTRIDSKSIFLSVEDRDGMLQSGMEEGTESSSQRLDELLEELKK